MEQYIIPALAGILVAIIEAVAARDRKRVRESHEKQEKRAEIRAEESRLAMQLMDATLQLSIVNANAVTGGHNNGNVERARKAADKAQKEYHAFLEKVASGALTR